MIFVFISCSSSPHHKVMKVGCWSPLSHSQALAKEHLARPSTHSMPCRIWRKFLSASGVLQLCPCHQPASHLSQGFLVCSGSPCTHPAPFPSTRLWGSLLTSVFCFQASYPEYSSKNSAMCLLSYWFWLWGLRWDQHLPSCELSPAKTLGFFRFGCFGFFFRCFV